MPALRTDPVRRSTLGTPPGLTRLALVLALGAAACGGTETPVPDATGVGPDSSIVDAGPLDSGLHPDAAAPDVGPTDSGVHPDAAAPDVGPTDSGVHPDAAAPDSGPQDTGVHPDAAAPDSGPQDTGVHPDAAAPDSGPQDTGVLQDAGVIDSGSADAGDPDAATVVFFDAGTAPVGIGVWDWTPIATGPNRGSPDDATWMGSELLISGGRGTPSYCLGRSYFYNPATDTWRSSSRTGLPAPGFEDGYAGSVHVFTGRELLDFGGSYCGLTPHTSDEVQVYNPVTDLTTASIQSLGGGVNQAGAWSGTELLVYPTEDPFNPAGIISGARFDPLSGLWTAMSTMNQPAYSARYYGAWTGSEFLVWGGTAQSSGRYDPVADTWSALPMPSFSLSRDTAVWTDGELFVWDGVSGGRYDPALGQWSQTSTVGAPTQIVEPLVVWTGEEVIVVGEGGGAHYDPTQDTWLAINNNDPHFPPTLRRPGYQPIARAEWAGSELLVLVSGSPTQGWKYGPKVTGQTSCDGGDATLNVRIDSPTSRRTWSGALAVSASTGPGPIASVAWDLDGTPLPVTGASGTIDAAGLAMGAKNLRVVVTDFSGNSACHEVTLFVDRPPSVQVDLPAPGIIRTAQVPIRATCTDDSGACWIRMTSPVQMASTGPTLETTVDVTGLEDLMVRVQAFDGRHIPSSVVSQTQIVELSPNLTVVAQGLPGEVCDADPLRVLWADATDFYLRDLGTGLDTVVSTGRSPNCADSRLVGTSAALLVDNVYARVWDGTLGTRWVSYETRTNLPWTVSRSGAQLYLRNLSLGTVETVSTTAHNSGAFDVAPDGTTYWMDTSGGLFAYSPGGTSATLGATGAVPGVPGIVATSTEAAWRFDTGGAFYRLDRFGAGGLAPLFDPVRAWGSLGPDRGQDYARNGEYLAYQGTDAVGTVLLWARTQAVSAPIPNTVGAEFKAVSSAGHVLYALNGRYFVRHSASGMTTDVAVTRGAAFARGPELYLKLGDTLMRVVP